MLKRNQILQNRLNWINYLKQPDTKKGVARLDQGDGIRCCLGHACYVLNIEPNIISENDFYSRITYDGELLYAPGEVVERLGLFDKAGRIDGFDNLPEDYQSLSTLNDGSHWTPQMIGEYLETVIEGGNNTPFLALDFYDE